MKRLSKLFCFLFGHSRIGTPFAGEDKCIRCNQWLKLEKFE